MTRYLLATIVAFSASAAALAQVPLRFSASIETFRWHAYAVELHDGTLMYSDATTASNPPPVAITPTAEHWREFRGALDRVGVWTWRQSYMPTEPFSMAPAGLCQFATRTAAWLLAGATPIQMRVLLDSLKPLLRHCLAENRLAVPMMQSNET
jgi:hypothetical protein